MVGDRDKAKSFIHKYVEFTANQESPLSFHLWSALTVLGAAMGRKCYLDRSNYKIFPNLFTVLVAGSALCRKSTAVNLAIEMLTETASTMIISGKVTPEKLTKDIVDAQRIDLLQPENSTSPNVLIFSSELSVFLTKQSYGEPIIHLLTDLFDCPTKREFRTKNRGVDTLHNVFISILAATTPDGVARGVPESALQEGFASRIMFVYEEDTDRVNPDEEYTPLERQLKRDCVNLLGSRSRLYGEFRLTDDAKQWYRDWYVRVHKKSKPKDRRLEGFFGRKHTHLLRIAMLMAGSFGETEIWPGDLEAALDTVEMIETTSTGAFKEIGATGVAQHFNRFLAYMRSARRINHSLLLKMMYPCSAKEFAEIIETALQSRIIMRDPQDPKTYVLL